MRIVKCFTCAKLFTKIPLNIRAAIEREIDNEIETMLEKFIQSLFNVSLKRFV